MIDNTHDDCTFTLVSLNDFISELKVWKLKGHDPLMAIRKTVTRDDGRLFTVGVIEYCDPNSLIHFGDSYYFSTEQAVKDWIHNLIV